MKRIIVFFIILCLSLSLLGCDPAAAVVKETLITDEGIIDVEAPVHTPEQKKLLTPPPTPSPTPLPTPDPTPPPTQEPSPTPSEKPAKTPKPTEKNSDKKDSPAKTETPAPAFVEAPDNSTLIPVVANDSGTAIDTILAMTNQQRANNGLAALSKSSTLMKAAATRAQEISVSFSHTRPDGSSALSMSSAIRAENIASGMNISHATIMDGWMNSSGHRQNILNGSYSSIGIGFYSANGYNYYVQLFG